MKIKFLSWTALICSFLYIFTFVVASWRLHVFASNHSYTARLEFDAILDHVQTLEKEFPNNPEIYTFLKNAVTESQSLAALILGGPNGAEFAAERSGSFLKPNSETPRFMQRYDIAAETLFAPVLSGTIRNRTLSASFLRFSQENLFLILRDSLILILATLSLALLMLILHSIRKNTQQEQSLSQTSHSRAQSSMAAHEDEFSIPDLVPELQDNQTQNIQEQQYSDSNTSITNTISQNENEILTVSGNEEHQPLGLFKPESMVGWEEYTLERLQAELHRCASFEQDLCLIVMQATNECLEWTNNLKDFAQLAVSFFSFRDLIFERARGGLSIILPNIDLDHGIRMAEQFMSKLTNHSEIMSNCIKASQFRIGLSSRAGRLVESERLMKEAEAAMLKATEENSKILAFRSDAERYRSFISKQE